MAKKLVAYFSATGNTAHVAAAIAGKVGADLFEIAPQESYSAADLNWRDAKSRTTKERNDPAFRPAMKEPCGDLAAYDVVFVGFPIWWYKEPNIVDTFLDGADLTGKTLVLFATAGSSGFGSTARNLQKTLGSGVKVVEGKVFYNDSYAKELDRWLEHLAI